MEIKKWFGLRNTTSPERFKPGEMAVATDVEIDDTGKLMSREGMTVVSVTPAHSLYANDFITLVVEGTALRAVEPDFSRTTIRNLTTSAPISYETFAGTVYYSNGVDSGRLVGRTHSQWGVTPPVGQPYATQIPGKLPPGRYMYAMTFLRDDGHESGTGAAGSIEVPAFGGVQFSAMEVSTNPLVSAKLLYLSEANGEVMYEVAKVPNGTTTHAVTSNFGGPALTTQFAGPPPAGSMVRYFNGNMFVVVGSTAFYSDPYNLELFRPSDSYMQFPGQVALFESVNDGLYVATADMRGEDGKTAGRTWYLAGARPDQMKNRTIFDYGAVPGSGARTMASYFNTTAGDAGGAIDPGAPAVVWSSRNGICVGFDGGLARNLTEERFELPFSKQAAAVVRMARGFAQYIAVLR